MYIKKIDINIGMESKSFSFDWGMNLIYSKGNSVGKTTLMRLLLHGFGYSIPETKGFPLDESVSTKMDLVRDSKEISIERHKDFAVVEIGEDKYDFSLPTEHLDLMGLLVNTNDRYILDNLLGVFYFDQDKGWTLLNRGKVIGNNRFNIEEFISGLNDSNETKQLIQKRDTLTHQINKYKSVFEITKYRSKVMEENKDFIFDNRIEQLLSMRKSLVYERDIYKREVKELKAVESENKGFIEYIEKMRITLRVGDELIDVNKENIDGFEDYSQIINTKISLVKNNLSRIERNIEEIDSEIKESKENYDFEEEFALYQQEIKEIEIDQVQVEKIIDSLRAQKRDINRLIKSRLNMSNEAVTKMSSNVLLYCERLGIKKYIDTRKTLFTSDLSSLSGRILSQMVFAYKLSYIKEFSRVFNIQLPIIIDSPRNNEITEENADKMFDLLSVEFGSHQIIVSSVYQFNRFSMNTISIKEYLMEDSN